MRPESRGMLFALMAVTMLAAQDGVAKHLVVIYNAPVVIMIRYWAFAAFVALMAMRAHGGLRAVARTRHPWLQMLRGAILGVVTISGVYLFAKIGLARAHAIFASVPLIVAALSMPMLGEHVGWRRWAAILAGFAGVLIMLQPGAGEVDVWMVLALAMSAVFAFYGILTRMVSRHDGADTSIFYTAFAGLAVVSAIGPFFWTPIAPADWGWLALMCVLAILGHSMLIRAFDAAPAARVQPFTYVQTVIASGVGVVVFGEALRANTVLGAAIVIGAGVFAAWREQAAARRPSAR